MKKSAVLLLITLFVAPWLRADQAGWSRVPQILSRIRAPWFPHRDFVITNFGAVADGKTDCTDAIRRAIAACAKHGGRVVVPAGEFLTGPIHLKSRVNLHLDAGATLKFTTDPGAYLPAVFSRFESVECYNYSPFIYAFGCKNVAVTGEGTLDGQATEENWLQWKGGRNAGTNSYRIANERLKKMASEGVPVAQRRFGAGDYLRPNFIQFNRCRNVLIEGVHIRRSPMWETRSGALHQCHRARRGHRFAWREQRRLRPGKLPRRAD